MEETVKIVREGNVAVVSLNRPGAANSMNSETLGRLFDVFTELRVDHAVRGVVVTGEGKHFCAGADISEMSAMGPEAALAFAELGQKVMSAIEKVGKPVIAAVQGHAAGGGLELALACDFIVSAPNAVFSSPEILLGIIPGFGATQRLSRLLGKARAKEMVLTGERIGAESALGIGLVNRILPQESLLADATALMTAICSRGPLSLRLGKEVIDAGFDVDLASACRMERDAFALCFASEDQKEGMGAFLEKRQPKFTRD